MAPAAEAEHTHQPPVITPQCLCVTSHTAVGEEPEWKNTPIQETFLLLKFASV